MIVSNGGGSSYAFGDYTPSNETWTPAHTAAGEWQSIPSAASAGVGTGAGAGAGAGAGGGDATARTDLGPDANWMAGQWAGDRFMNIGWAMGSHPLPNFPNDGGYLTLLCVTFRFTRPPPSCINALFC